MRKPFKGLGPSHRDALRKLKDETGALVDMTAYSGRVLRTLSRKGLARKLSGRAGKFYVYIGPSDLEV